MSAMKKSKNAMNWSYKYIFIFAASMLCPLYSWSASDLEAETNAVQKIESITVTGNQCIATSTIMSHIPYHIGDVFKPQKSRQLIKSLYRLGSLHTIKIKVKEISPESVALTIVVSEKTPITDFCFSNNKNLKKDEIEKKLKLSEIKAVDAGDVHVLAESIKKMYGEKDYHHVSIDASVEKKIVEGKEGACVVQVDIHEGKPTRVRRVFITGNCCVSSKKLRSLLFTREDWLFGFINRAGSYQPDAIAYDKSVIEEFYHNHGYLAAQVTDVIVDPVPNSVDQNVTFNVKEGDCYTIESVKAPENSLLSEEEILRVIPIRPGQIYSKEAIRSTLETLRMLWGEYGYIYADVDPSVIPDEKTKKVALTFTTNLGNKMKLNRITIIGNKKTCEHVVRRELFLEEGDLVTTRQLDLSKERVQALGYFDQHTGVNWKMIKIDQDRIDLELLLQEVSTGKLFAEIGFGGVATDRSSPSESFRVRGGIQDINWLGRGLQLNLNGAYSRQEWGADISLANQWLFDRPLYGNTRFFHRRSHYEEFRGSRNVPSEEATGGSGQIGFSLSRLLKASVLADVGAEHLEFRKVIAINPQLQDLMNRKFNSGTVVKVGANIMQDLRNHPMYPSNGYIWNLGFHAGVPHSSRCSFGYGKWEFEGQWYSPLIDEYDLVLRIHTFLGFIHQFGCHTIPYRDLYHVGGPATVRGFDFGQIGPWLIAPKDDNNFPLGAKKAFTLNIELLFPIKRDNSIRGLFFYDGGAGWDTPDRNLIPPEFIVRNNTFNFRHAVGFGIRLTSPMPLKLDVGFKLDRRKRWNESLSEVHFTMSQDFN